MARLRRFRFAPVRRIVRPFQHFFRRATSGGIVLIIASVFALVWANSAWGDQYFSLWQLKFGIGFGRFNITKDLSHWINDGLMAVFFFVVGLEIKREVLIGELSSLNKALLPIAGALGGMLMPALIYIYINYNTDALNGWGIPMATDIAFALGVLALLGSRMPLGIKVFLTALAIVDDLGAVVVIALFYSGDLWWYGILFAASFWGCMLVLNLLGARNSLLYLLPGIGLWLSLLSSGVHATIAGVLAALTIPARTRINAAEFVENVEGFLQVFKSSGAQGDNIISSQAQRGAVHAIEQACCQVESPLVRLEHKLHPWVAFVIIPVFALANAGIALDGIGGTLFSPVATGVMLGLILGKVIGIFLFSWLAVKFGLAALPAGTSWRQIIGVSALAGIGFTMSFFITDLAFDNEEFIRQAKTGILFASLIAGFLGWALIRSATTTAE
ncbi:MAG: Na+/H+ antiporter NhaA [Candidatus Dadabacteria bacterium]|nr:MAG: Na+/H+ antiporter NhaA [Candidatus Dadabacteria bacterium]